MWNCDSAASNTLSAFTPMAYESNSIFYSEYTVLPIIHMTILYSGNVGTHAHGVVASKKVSDMVQE